MAVPRAASMAATRDDVCAGLDVKILFKSVFGINETQFFPAFRPLLERRHRQLSDLLAVRAELPHPQPFWRKVAAKVPRAEANQAHAARELRP